MTILIVEDAVFIRKRLIEQVTGIPLVEKVLETGNYLKALDIIKNNRPGIVILDINIDNGNGIDLLARIKQSFTAIKVIMLTNYPFPQYRDKCLALGADYFLDKSRDFESLPEIVQELVTKAASPPA